jgi:hypothetical protein
VLAWLIGAIASLLVVAALLWGCHECRRKQEAGRIVTAIEAEDEEELRLLLEGIDFDSVREWFGDSAIILAVKSSATETGGFVDEAVRLFVSHGANVNEPGTVEDTLDARCRGWQLAFVHDTTGSWSGCGGTRHAWQDSRRLGPV